MLLTVPGEALRESFLRYRARWATACCPAGHGGDACVPARAQVPRAAAAHGRRGGPAGAGTGRRCQRADRRARGPGRGGHAVRARDAHRDSALFAKARRRRPRSALRRPDPRARLSQPATRCCCGRADEKKAKEGKPKQRHRRKVSFIPGDRAPGVAPRDPASPAPARARRPSIVSDGDYRGRDKDKADTPKARMKRPRARSDAARCAAAVQRCPVPTPPAPVPQEVGRGPCARHHQVSQRRQWRQRPWCDGASAGTRC
jgi:hypothetical protein